MKRSLFLLHFSVFLAGFTGIFGRLITLNAGLITWYRLMISAIALLLLNTFISRKSIFLGIKSIFRISFVGLLLGLHWVLFYASIKFSNISVGVVCFALCSFFTAFFAPFINRKKFSISELLLSGMVLCGIALIFGLNTSYRTGILLGVVSSMFASLYTIYNEKLTKVYDAQVITFYTMIGGFLGITCLLPLYLYLEPVDTIIPSYSDLGYLFILALICTVLLYFLITKSQKKVSPFTISLSFNLEPLYTIILAILFFNESKVLSGSFYLGLGLIMLSVVLQMVRVMREHKRLSKD